MNQFLILGAFALLFLNVVNGQTEGLGINNENDLFEITEGWPESDVEQIRGILRRLEPGSNADMASIVEDITVLFSSLATRNFNAVRHNCKPNTPEIVKDCMDSHNATRVNSLEQKCGVIQKKVECASRGIHGCPSLQSDFSQSVGFLNNVLRATGCSLTESDVDAHSEESHSSTASVSVQLGATTTSEPQNTDIEKGNISKNAGCKCNAISISLSLVFSGFVFVALFKSLYL